MEDIEYSTCVSFGVVVAEENKPAVGGWQSAGDERRRVEPCPWVMQDKGEA